MKIDPEVCVNCGECIVYCPVAAIEQTNDDVSINLDRCVECGACLKSGVCPVNAFYQQELEWPRILRAEFSDPLVYHKATKICGRGTSEVKTNDVSNRIGFGEVGVVIEVGRPCVSTDFNEIEKLTRVLCSVVKLAENNPVTHLLNVQTGLFKDRSIMSERVLSAIIECKVKNEELISVLDLLKKLADSLDTVFSLGLITRYGCDGEKPVAEMIKNAGIQVRQNGKVNVGLGRPLK